MQQKFDDEDWQFYFILFLAFLFIALLVVAFNFLLVRAPDVRSPKGRCEAFCSGVPGKIYIGHGNGVPIDCFCDYPPTPPNEKMLRRPN